MAENIVGNILVLTNDLAVGDGVSEGGSNKLFNEYYSRTAFLVRQLNLNYTQKGGVELISREGDKMVRRERRLTRKSLTTGWFGLLMKPEESEQLVTVFKKSSLSQPRNLDNNRCSSASTSKLSTFQCK